MSIFSQMLCVIATLGPIGRLPAPGTAGSAIAVLSGLYLMSLGPFILILSCIACIIIGTFASAHYTDMTGRDDPSEVIIDEVAGQWSVLIYIPFGTPNMLIWAATGFILFRFFDILKPPPVSTAEVLPGGFGIMADDIVAGALAGFSLLVLSFFSGTPFI